MKLHTLFSLLALVYTIPCLADSPMLFTGAIQFPQSIKSVPDVSIYYSGSKAICEKQEQSKRVSFTVKANRNINKFLLLVTPALSIETVQKTNTIKYLKATPPYKFYTLSLTKKEQPDLIAETAEETEPSYTWEVVEEKRSSRIPDNTIIVCYDPNFIETVEGGNAIEFMKVLIKPNILELVGSEEKFQDKSVELLLSSIDYDTFHTRIHPEVKQEGYKSYIVI